MGRPKKYDGTYYRLTLILKKITLSKLQELSHKRSLETKKEVTYQDLIQEALNEFIERS